jgi:SLAP domain-containing protein
MMIDKFKLSYSPLEAGGVSKLSESIYYEQLETIDNIPEHSVLFHTLYVYEDEEVIEAKVFIINSTSKGANFQLTPLLLLDENGRVIAGEIKDLSNAGEIPSMNIRPYSIYFTKRNSDDEGFRINNKCKVIIDEKNILINQSHKIRIDYIDYKVSLTEKREIEKYIENMAPVKQNDVKLKVYKSDIDNNNNPYIILALINGMDNKVNVSKFKLIYRDQAGNTRAVKQLEVLPEVKPKSASFFMYFIESDEIIKRPFDPTKCRVAIEA